MDINSSESIYRRRIDFLNSSQGMDKLYAEFKSFAQKVCLLENDYRKMYLALDEVVSNIVRYAYEDSEEHRIIVELILCNDLIEVRIMDDGVPFNALTVEKPIIDEHCRDRPIGGLGIHLVREFMDKLQYYRSDGINHLVLRRKLSSDT